MKQRLYKFIDDMAIAYALGRRDAKAPYDAEKFRDSIHVLTGRDLDTQDLQTLYDVYCTGTRHSAD